MKRALIIGFFCTIGDIDSLALVKRWLGDAKIPFNVAPFGGPPLDAIPGAVLPETVTPSDYTHVIIVCGPCDKSYYSRRWPINPIEFQHCQFIGINLSMIEPVTSWNPFDTLIERNSERRTRPDITFGMERKLAPVVGLCLAPSQEEYNDRQLHQHANNLLKTVARKINAAVVNIDTGWPSEMNTTGLENETQIESLIAHVDVVLTTRLHGTVYALKHGVPAVAIDPIRGGDKVILQARTLGWPEAYLAEEINEEQLTLSLNYCLSKKAKEKAIECSTHAKVAVNQIQNEFMAALEKGVYGAVNRWPSRTIVKRTLPQRMNGVRRRWFKATGRLLTRLAK